MDNPYIIPLSWRNLLATLVLTAALWLTPFAVWPSLPQPAEKKMAYRAPVVRFMGTFQGADGTAWSPVVFPLPTKYGFSESVDAQNGGHDVSALMKLRVFEGVFHNITAPAPDLAVLGALDGPDTPRGYRPTGLDETVFRSAARKAGPGWLPDVEPALSARRYAVDLSEIGAPGLPSQGSVDAYVELDLRGYPLHVLLDGSTGNVQVDRAIIRALYKGRALQGGAGEAGRIHLYYRDGTNAR